MLAILRGVLTLPVFAILLFNFMFRSQLAVAEEPIFVPNTQSHAEGIVRCRFLSSGKEAVTISSDKTVRVWDLTTQRVVKTVRLPIAVGMEGKLMCMAVTPDDQFVAVAGYSVSAMDHGQVYVISLRSGKTERVLQGHKGFVFGLAVSPDGKRLASAGEDKTARVWDLKTGTEICKFEGHTNFVYSVVFSPDGKSVASASLDLTAKVWDSQTATLTAQLIGHTDKVRAIDWSSDGKAIVTASWDTTVRVWTPEGQALQTIDAGGTAAFAVCFTADARSIAVANGNLAGNDKAICYRLFDRETGKATAVSDSLGAAVGDLDLSPDGTTVAVCGGLTGQAHFFNTSSAKPQGGLKPASYMVTVVGWAEKNQSICWGGSPDDPSGINRPQEDLAARKMIHHFDFSTLTLSKPKVDFVASCRNRSDINGTSAFRVVDLASTQFTARGVQGAKFNVTAPDTLRSIPSLSPKNDLAVVGSERGLWLFETETGQLKNQLIGHSGSVLDAVFSKDGQYILSGSTDRTVRVWRVGTDRPLVSVYAVDGEWVAWTPEGYYAASAGGEKMVGWVVNGKPDENPTFHPAERFHDSLYRPDVIKRLLSFGNVSDALKDADQARGRKSAKLDVKKLEPPKVTFTGDLSVGRDGKVSVSVEATSPNGDGIKSLTLLVNGGRTLGTSAVKPKTGTRALEKAEWADVQLEPGRNTLKVFAKTDRTEGAEEVTVEVQQQRKQGKGTKPTLHLLTVAISDYPQNVTQDDRMPLLFESVNGANGFETTFTSHVGGDHSPYAKVRTVSIHGQKATRKQLLAQLGTFAADIPSDRDVAVVYISGHGVLVGPNGKLTTEAGETSGAAGENWVFCTHDFRKTNPLATGITDDELCTELRKIRASRVLLVIDACHSGGINGAVTRKAGQESNGFDVLCACQKSQVAFEHKSLNAPLFTNLIIRGLNNDLTEYKGVLYDTFPDLNGEGVAFSLLQTGVGYMMNKQGEGQKMVYLPSNRGEYLLTSPKK